MNIACPATLRCCRLLPNFSLLVHALNAAPPCRLRNVHRLDKDTSGVLLLAKSAAVATQLGALFKSNSVSKMYWCGPLCQRVEPALRCVLRLVSYMLCL